MNNLEKSCLQITSVTIIAFTCSDRFVAKLYHSPSMNTTVVPADKFTVTLAAKAELPKTAAHFIIIANHGVAFLY